MTPVEIIALIFGLVILLKILIILIDRGAWLKFATAVTKNTALATIVYLILALIVAYFLLQSYSIIDFAAIALLFALLFGIALLPYMHTMLDLAKKRMKNRKYFWSKSWLSFIIWVLIALWVIYTLIA